MVILCHPLKESFNHAIADAMCSTIAAAGHIVVFHDLYDEDFPPVLTPEEILRHYSFNEQVRLHAGQLASADVLIIIHPDWWGQPPALLKGWIDRIFEPGTAYEFTGEEFMEKLQKPLLVGKKAMVVCTTDSEEDEGTLLEHIWTQKVFAYCGMRVVKFHILYDVRNASHQQRTKWLRSVVSSLSDFLR